MQRCAFSISSCAPLTFKSTFLAINLLRFLRSCSSSASEILSSIEGSSGEPEMGEEGEDEQGEPNGDVGTLGNGSGRVNSVGSRSMS